jgi:dolichyl-diphosphooligosaccharide--protein glycosyltransferase
LFGFGVPEGIIETASMFSPQFGTLFGPTLFFGFSLFFALPYVLWSLYVGYREYSPRLLLLGTYAAVFTVLAVLQVRFAGELSIALAPFAGLALVHMASVVDAIPRPTVLDAPTYSETHSSCPPTASLRIPDRQTIVALTVVFLLIGGFGLVQGPIQTNKLVYSDDAYRTATWLESRAMQSEQAPESTYVLSAWGENRMYNAFVSGDSRSYGFAQETYTEFISSPQPDSWYERLSSRTDYIVLTAVANQNDAGYEQTTHAMLYNSYGSATAAHDGVGRYQAVYQSPRGSHIVVRPVAGAVIEGTAEAGSTVSISTEVSVPNAEFTYTRRAQVAANGTYRIRVPYAGTYTVGDTQVSVSADAVESGTVVQAR